VQNNSLSCIETKKTTQFSQRIDNQSRERMKQVFFNLITTMIRHIEEIAYDNIELPRRLSTFTFLLILE
jgi:hypothetical protein